jgi:AbiV family abortive infection protein
MMGQSFPMPTSDQLRALRQAARQNAVDLAADARLLLDAGRFPRAYALAVLALEELGKGERCRDVLAGELDEKRFRKEWRSHVPKLVRIQVFSILFGKTMERIFADGDKDHMMKLHGLYVEANPTDASGPPMTPSDVTREQAVEMVELAEEITAGAESEDWTIPYD